MSGPVGPVRAADHQLRSPMGGFVSDDERDAAFRSFQFMGAVSNNMAAGCAITNTSTMTSAFAYLWVDGEFTELRLAARDGDTATFAEDPDDGVTIIVTSRGSVSMAATPGGTKRLTVDSPTLSIDVSFEDDHDVLRLCTPTGPTGWAYVQKVAGVPARGHAIGAHSSSGSDSSSAPQSTVDFEAIEALAHHDYTTGFLRSETWWHWACLAGRTADGRRLGLNLSCGTNESGYRENGGWLDGRWFDLGGALFVFDPDDTESTWHIMGTDDRFHLTFEPGHGYHARHDSPAMGTNFHQLFGNFEGWLVGPDGERIDIVAGPGFTESQYLRW